MPFLSHIASGFTRSTAIALSAVVLLGACSQNSATPTVTGIASNIRPANSSGTILWDKLADETNSRRVDGAGVGYAYKSGIDGNGTLIAFSGLVNADTLQPPTTGGKAVYRGTSSAIVVTRDTVFAKLLGGQDYARSARTSNVTIQADLDQGTFKGENGGNQQGGKFTHRFNGKITNGALTGSGQLNIGRNFSMESRLDGKMSDSRALLVFEGADGQTAVAGGMDLARE